MDWRWIVNRLICSLKEMPFPDDNWILSITSKKVVFNAVAPASPKLSPYPYPFFSFLLWRWYWVGMERWKAEATTQKIWNISINSDNLQQKKNIKPNQLIGSVWFGSAFFSLRFGLGLKKKIQTDYIRFCFMSFTSKRNQPNSKIFDQI